MVLWLLPLALTAGAQLDFTDPREDEAFVDRQFDKLELQGVDTKQMLRFTFYFVDRNKANMEKLKKALKEDDYKFTGLGKHGTEGELEMTVEKAEFHDRKSLKARTRYMHQIAKMCNVATFDGFEIGNIDASKPLVTPESFKKFVSERKEKELFNLGIRLYQVELNDKAEWVFKECLRRNVKKDTVYLNLGNALMGMGKKDRAIQMLEQATLTNPNYIEAYLTLGALCYKEKEYKRAVEYYGSANRISPDNEAILVALAAAQFKNKDLAAAKENCKRVIRINKYNEDAKNLLKQMEDGE